MNEPFKTELSKQTKPPPWSYLKFRISLKNRKLSMKGVVALILISVLATSFFSFIVWSPDLSYNTVVMSGSMTTEASYIFFKADWDSDETDSEYFVRDGLTGEIVYSGTNCSLLIQTVIDSADDAVRIHFVHGVYYIDTTIEVTKILRVSGECQGYYWGYPEFPASHTVKGTVLVLIDNVTRGMFHWNTSTQLFNGWFEHIELNGGGAEMSQTYQPDWNPNPIGTCPLIWMEGMVSDIWFDHVFISHSGTEGVRITAEYGDIWNIYFTDCMIEMSVGAGIHLNTGDSGYRLERVHIRGVHFYDNGNDIHIQDAGVNDVSITECTSELTKYTFLIVTYGARDLTVTNNELYDGGCEATGDYSSAFLLNSTTYSLFAGNIIKNLENDTGWEDGFNVTASSYLKFDENLVYNNTGSGISFGENVDNCTLNDNTIAFNDRWGIDIQVASCDTNLIDGNIIVHNTAGHIDDSGTGTVTGDNITS